MPISLFKQVALVCLTVMILVNDIFIYLSVLVILPFFTLFFQIGTCVACIKK